MEVSNRDLFLDVVLFTQVGLLILYTCLIGRVCPLNNTLLGCELEQLSPENAQRFCDAFKARHNELVSFF